MLTQYPAFFIAKRAEARSHPHYTANTALILCGPAFLTKETAEAFARRTCRVVRKVPLDVALGLIPSVQARYGTWYQNMLYVTERAHLIPT